MKIGIIGLGLIGGSYALAFKKKFKAHIYGEDLHHFPRALALGLADEKLNEKNLRQTDIIIIATPVDSIAKITAQILDKISPETLVLDAGSIKHPIAQKLSSHPKRENFLLSHPIAGTEYSGPDAAFGNLFEGKTNIFCDTEQTQSELVKKAYEIMETLGMKTIEMKSNEHDRHIAYVSHLSHISSFMLGKTVMDLEKDEKNIFAMAGSGFASTVRLAKSSPDTWTPIFLENKKHILQSLEEYIGNLEIFKRELSEGNYKNIHKKLQQINHIKSIIDKLEKI